MIYKLLTVILIGISVSSCSLIRSKPVEKDFHTRLNEFPTDNIPLESKAEIRWNEYQIPFIKAESDRDAALLLGMTHAHLRLGQMYLFREVVNHRLAKHVGPFATVIDHSLMAMDLFAATDEIEQRMDAETKLWLTAFVEGINLYQDRMKDVPTELRALNIKPAAWAISDIIKIGRMISADVNWFSWFSYLKLQDEPGWDIFWEKILAGGSGSVISSETVISQIFHGMSKSGSNAFAVSPSKSSSSEAIMASDPHLGLMLPNMWLVAGFQSPSYHVVGMMFPALPMVLIGRNESIAFSGTNMRSASSDLYELDAEDASLITEARHTIAVKGWFNKRVTLRKHPIGPIISDAPLFKSNGRTIAMKWVGHEYSDELSATLKMNKAQNWNEFVSSFENYAVSGQNYLYADVSGNIGLVPAVKIPIRSYSIPSDIVFPASAKDTAWKGYLGVFELPNIYNPDSGFVASANNQPVESSTPLGFFFSSDDRIQRMNDYLGGLEKMGHDEIKYLHTDTYVRSAHNSAQALAKQIKIHHKSLPKGSIEILGTLSNWDGFYRTQSKEPVVYQLLLYYFAKEFYTLQYDKVFVKRLMGSDMLSEFLSKDIEQVDPEIVISSLQKAILQTLKRHKRFKTWGDMHRLSLNHNLGRIPLIGKRFRFGDYAIGGTSNSLMKTAHSLGIKKHSTAYGANARYYSFMGNANENYFVLLGGQDGWIGSEGLDNQVPLWMQGEYIRIPLDWSAIEETFEYKLEFSIPTN